MSFAEVKERVKDLTPAELEDLALHIAFLRKVNDPAWRSSVQQSAAGPRHGEATLDEVDRRSDEQP